MVINLKAGDNLIIPFPGTQSIAMADFNDTLRIVYGNALADYTCADYKSFYLPLSIFSSITEFVPGSAYLVRASSDFDIIIP
jgi:hypothetical protein